MQGFTGWTKQAGGLARALMVTALLAGLPGAAWAQPASASHELLQPADPELAAIARDIMLLRMINQVALTRDQIAAVIPELEGLLREEQAMRRDVKDLMLQQRRALLKGDVPEADLEAARRKMKERSQQFRDQTQTRLEALGRRLTPEQARRLRTLVMAGPGLWRHGASGPSDRRTQGRRIGSRGAEDVGPSAVVLEQIIVLLKEKLEVMPK